VYVCTDIEYDGNSAIRVDAGTKGHQDAFVNIKAKHLTYSLAIEIPIPWLP
jgi:hypothetical protein